MFIIHCSWESIGVDADLKSPKGGINVELPSGSADVDADLSGKGGIDLPSGGLV